MLRSVLEAVKPHPGSFDPRAMARGEPGVPMRFDWRGRTYVVAEVMGAERETEPEGAPGGELYVRRHAIRVRTDSGEVMVLSGTRGARGAPTRWMLRHIEDGDPSPPTS